MIFDIDSYKSNTYINITVNVKVHVQFYIILPCGKTAAALSCMTFVVYLGTVIEPGLQMNKCTPMYSKECRCHRQRYPR